jgi:putative endonuclease
MQGLSRQNVGKRGEDLVAQWLKDHGYKIIERNFRCRGGEVDVIAQKEEVLAFVEVKCRKRNYFALSEVITKSKQQKIAFAAQSFLYKRPTSSLAIRFDVALVEGIDDSETITYIERAFRDERFSW